MSGRKSTSEAPSAAVSPSRTKRETAAAPPRASPGTTESESGREPSLFIILSQAGRLRRAPLGRVRRGFVFGVTGLASGASARRPAKKESKRSSGVNPSALFVAELVADAPDGQNHLWVLGVVLDLGPQAVDVRVNGAVVAFEDN